MKEVATILKWSNLQPSL